MTLPNKKIAIYMASLDPSGGVKVIFRTANNLRNAGYDVVLYVAECAGKYPLEYQNSCEIVYASAPLRNVLHKMYWLFKVKSDANIALATYFVTAFPVWLSRNKFEKRIYYIQAYEAAFFARPMKTALRHFHQYLLARLSYFLPLEMVANCDSSKEGIPEKRRADVPEIEPGIDLDLYKPDTKSSGRIRIGHLSRAQPWKGSNDFFLATKRLREMGEEFDICVAYDLWPDTCGLEYEAVFPANEAELAKFYASCDIVVSSAWDKGFGYPPLETMACGSVCFATPMDFGSAYVDHIPIRPHDPDSIVDAFLWYRNNPEAIPRIIEAGLQTATSYSWDTLTRSWVNILEAPA